jgi:hypothetical protein
MRAYSGITSHANALPHVRFTPMNKVGEIGHPNGGDLLAGEKNIKNGIHFAISHQLLVLKAER